MRTKTIAAVLALAAALAACKKEEKGAATDDKGKEPAAEPAPQAPATTPPTTTPPATTAAAPGDTVTLAMVPPAVGAKWSEEQVQTMDLKISADGQHAQLSRQSSEKKQVEVLGVSGGVVTRAKITYDVSDQQTMNGKPRAMPAPHHGKTYVLEAAGDKVTVTLDGGAAASPAEVEAILDAEDRFGKPSKMEALIAGRSFKKGEAVDFPADQIADALGDKKGMKVTKLTLTYSGADGANPVFDMTMGFTQEQPGMTLHVQATGKVTADIATGELLAMTVEGPVEMSGKATATGTIKMSGTRSQRQ